MHRTYLSSQTGDLLLKHADPLLVPLALAIVPSVGIPRMILPSLA